MSFVTKTGPGTPITRSGIIGLCRAAGISDEAAERQFQRMLTIVGLASGAPCPEAGQYLKSFTPGGPGNRGYLVTTPDVAKALRFASIGDAHTFWRQAHGIRADGKPNRPLTAFTIETLAPDTAPLTAILDNPPPGEQH